jgi:hypothetical protein
MTVHPAITKHLFETLKTNHAYQDRYLEAREAGDLEEAVEQLRVAHDLLAAANLLLLAYFDIETPEPDSVEPAEDGDERGEETAGLAMTISLASLYSLTVDQILDDDLDGHLDAFRVSNPTLTSPREED